MATRRNNTTDESATAEVMSPSELGKAGQEIAVSNRFTREEYGSIESFDDAMALAQASFGDVLSAHEQPLLGDGFRVATEDDKRRLIGVPLLLLDWAFVASDYGNGDYIAIHAVSRDDNGKAVKWVLTDGGTGIAKDLREYTQKTGRMGGLGVRHGLRISEYSTDAETGKPISKNQVREYMSDGLAVGKGHTFYLDTSA